MKSCAILQIESIHEIVTPGIIYSLNKNNYKPILFFNKGCSDRRGQFFPFCENLEFDLIEFAFSDGYTFNQISDTIQENNCDFAIVNTLQKNDKLDSYISLNLPLIGIVHNVNIFLESDKGLDFANQPNFYLLTIAPHVSFYLRNRLTFEKTNIDYYIPSYLVDERHIKSRKLNQEKEEIVVAIAGGINNIRNRGFTELLNFLKTWDKDLNIKFVICGGGKDRNRLEKFVLDLNLSKYFDFVPVDSETEYVMYDNYYKALDKADFLLTLFPPNDIKYFKFKATASIMTAISLGLPIITDITARTLYGVPCITYRNDDLSTLFSLLDNVSAEKYSHQVERILDYRKECRLRSDNTFMQAINCILAEN